MDIIKLDIQNMNQRNNIQKTGHILTPPSPTKLYRDRDRDFYMYVDVNPIESLWIFVATERYSQPVVTLFALYILIPCFSHAHLFYQTLSYHAFTLLLFMIFFIPCFPCFFHAHLFYQKFLFRGNRYLYYIFLYFIIIIIIIKRPFGLASVYVMAALQTLRSSANPIVNLFLLSHNNHFLPCLPRSSYYPSTSYFQICGILDPVFILHPADMMKPTTL